MSKNSAKTNYTQLTEWLSTFKAPKVVRPERPGGKFSRSDYYKQKGA